MMRSVKAYQKKFQINSQHIFMAGFLVEKAPLVQKTKSSSLRLSAVDAFQILMKRDKLTVSIHTMLRDAFVQNA